MEKNEKKFVLSWCPPWNCNGGGKLLKQCPCCLYILIRVNTHTHSSFSVVISPEARANDAWLFSQLGSAAHGRFCFIWHWKWKVGPGLGLSALDGLRWRKMWHFRIWQSCSTFNNFPLLEVRQKGYFYKAMSTPVSGNPKEWIDVGAASGFNF